MSTMFHFPELVSKKPWCLCAWRRCRMSGFRNFVWNPTFTLEIHFHSPRLVSAFRICSSVTFVDPAGNHSFSLTNYSILMANINFQIYLWNIFWRQCLDPYSQTGLQMAKYNIETRSGCFSIKRCSIPLETIQNAIPIPNPIRRWFILPTCYPTF